MIYQGNCLAVLKTLPAESVQCVVTSPPYWGLRDYGTADWTGGRADCQHREQRGGRDPATSGKQLTNQGTVQTQYARVCRDCGAERVDAQIGLEATPDEYVASLVDVFAEVHRVLSKDGTLWLNLGDSYASGKGTCHNPGGNTSSYNVHLKAANVHPRDRGNKSTLAAVGLKPKDLVGIPWRVAFALQAFGWYLRADVIWHKPNPMPESILDRPTKSHEYLFLLTKSERYYYDADAIAEPLADGSLERYQRAIDKSETYDPDRHKHGDSTMHNAPMEVLTRAAAGVVERGTRNKRSVWTIPTESFEDAHFATFPEALVEPCIRAGSRAAGKRCDCDDVIATPLGEDGIDDPTLETGRAGFNRPRLPGQGTRPITRREQRSYAAQCRDSDHRGEMEAAAGVDAFAHYIRTDLSGARAIPPELLDAWRALEWLQPPPPCTCPEEPADIILDPFGGAGTVGVVAVKLQRRFILIDLNAEYVEMQRKRINGVAPLFFEVV